MWLKKKRKKSTILKGICVQEWNQVCNDSSKASNYYLHNPCFGFEKDIGNLPLCYKISMTKLRTAKNTFSVEKGRYINLLREQRSCSKVSQSK